MTAPEAELLPVALTLRFPDGRIVTCATGADLSNRGGFRNAVDDVTRRMELTEYGPRS